jgi:serine/threonine protein kinase
LRASFVLSQLGPYLIDEELAQGGMARVFRARLRGLGGFEKTLVIKQILPELAKDPHFVELFVREANTLVSLSHPHIVPVYELGAAEGTYYLSMEYVEGATVAQMLEHGALTPALVAHLGAQICEALEYAHSRFGILHRDLTPRNIIVDQAGHARLVDFGIAASTDAVDSGAFGSPGYMPPEQIAGQRMTAQSDLFALGAVLFEALTARPAFPKSLRGSLEHPAAFDSGDAVPDELQVLVQSLLAAPPEQRPGSAAEVARRLRAILAREHPHGALDEMQRRVREARPARPSPQPAPAPTEATARIEAKAIATSPVLTEILRSSAFAPIPKPPGQAPATAQAPASPAGLEAGTRRIRSASQPADQPEAEPERADRTNPRLTSWMMRAWPVLALLALVAAWLGRSDTLRSSSREPPRTQPSIAPPPHSSGAEPGDHAGSAPAPSTPATTPATAPTTKPVEPSSGGQTQVSVNAKPWAEVLLDGRSVGTTPLRNVKLRAGVHTLSLRCPPLGREATLKLDFAAARPARVVVDLSANPARTFLDGVREAR